MNNRSAFFTLCLLLVFSTILTAQNLIPMEQLGKNLFFDKISDPDNMSCAKCHAVKVGFTGPIPSVNNKGAVYKGAVSKRFGNRKPPSSAYANLSPIFDYDASEGLFFGGNFWNGRATGWKLGNPAADQALGPFLNPVEQNNASKEEVLKQIAKSKYANLWEAVWGEPISYETQADINKNYDRVGLSIAAFEGSEEVNPFTSKFDYYLAGKVSFTAQEKLGMELFNDENKGKCFLCHLSDGPQPLFTDFTYDNLGTPRNPDNPFYEMDEVYLDDGSPINPLGDAWIDYGLGDFLRQLAETYDDGWRDLPYVTEAVKSMTFSQLEEQADANDGKHKVPTLRNVDKRPGNGFIKAYMHNGVFKSLKEVVHFYNTRDVLGENWLPPEVEANVNTEELGDLGLTNDEEDAIVAFMKTLSDGYKIGRMKKDGNNLQLNEMATSLSVEGPNPFNPSTRLGYYIPDDGNIQLEVFNITGEKVMTLHNGFMSAGEHQAIFNAGNLASGLYLVSLITEREINTVKLMLMK